MNDPVCDISAIDEDDPVEMNYPDGVCFLVETADGRIYRAYYGNLVISEPLHLRAFTFG